eukprot:scaffold1211_cov195-Alexandrium_tamarense.AAC.8
MKFRPSNGDNSPSPSSHTNHHHSLFRPPPNLLVIGAEYSSLAAPSQTFIFLIQLKGTRRNTRN